jgi:hypothetical protein
MAGDAVLRLDLLTSGMHIYTIWAGPALSGVALQSRFKESFSDSEIPGAGTRASFYVGTDKRARLEYA